MFQFFYANFIISFFVEVGGIRLYQSSVSQTYLQKFVKSGIPFRISWNIVSFLEQR